MQKSLFTRFAAAVMITGSVFGAAAPALAAPATPANLSIVGGKYTNDTTPTFTWTPSAGATWYEFLLDDGQWQGIGNVSAYTLWTLPNGWHTFFVRSHDANDGVSVSTSVTFEIDTQGPTVSAVTPTSAKVGVSTDFSITSTGEAPTEYCQFRVNGRLGEKLRIKSGGGWTLPMTFTSVGSNTVQTQCVDADHNVSVGPVQSVKVSGSTTSSTPAVSVARGTAVKTQCGSYAPVGDACHAVYYYGLDGKKHLFPSESVYKSWYGSFDNVVVMTKGAMAGMPTGKNVTYRPGTSLVKFSTSSTVYAVDVNQTLRPIMNEAAAKAIYGARWNSYVVTIPASQRNDYTVGSKIYSSADYSKSQSRNAEKTIDDLWTTVYTM